MTQFQQQRSWLAAVGPATGQEWQSLTARDWETVLPALFPPLPDEHSPLITFGLRLPWRETTEIATAYL